MDRNWAAEFVQEIMPDFALLTGLILYFAYPGAIYGRMHSRSAITSNSSREPVTKPGAARSI